MRRICTCGKRNGVDYDTSNRHALDCAVNMTAYCDDIITGVKFDQDKPRVDLLIDGMPLALESISQVLTFGAKKYADHNWQKVPDGENRYKAALMRHILASSRGEKTDPETGISHLSHAACCLLFLLELELKKDA